jgi:hypothetical protein
MRIGFATHDWSTQFRGDDGAPTFGGAGWYRIGLPALGLKQHTDHEIIVGTLISHLDHDELGVRTWDGAHHWGCDVLVMQRWMNDDLPAKVARCVAEGQVIVNDVDDWFDGLDPQNRAFRASHPKINPEVNRVHYRGTLAHSSVLTVSTPYLAERLRRVNPNIVVLRNMISTSMFTCAEHTPSTPPKVGWVGGLPWRSGDLETLRGVVAPFLERSGCSFHHAGHVESSGLSARDALRIPDDVRVTTEPMQPIDRYAEMFRCVDVGIAPLADKPFNEAKSAIKGMEYAAAGVPFVASATSEYRWLLDECGIGRVAKRPQHWSSHLRTLLDAETYAADVERNRAFVGAHDVSVRWHDWRELYESLVSSEVASGS